LSPRALFAILSLFIPLFVYSITLCPTAYWLDSGELIASAYTMGIAHPTGYPLYIIIGRLFTVIPIASVAERLAFLSAVCGALSSLFIYLSSLRLTKNPYIALICSLSASFSLYMWDMANTAEVYSLNVLFTAVIVYLLLNLSEEWGYGRFYLLVFLTGLGMSNHMTLGAVIPAAVVVLLFSGYRSLLMQVKVVIPVLLLFVLGLSLYLYIPIRAVHDPPLNWGDARTLTALSRHLILSSHSDYFFARSIHQVLNMVSNVLSFYLKGFGIPASILILAGIVLMSIRRIVVAVALLLPVFVLTVLVINFGSGSRMAAEQHAFYLPSAVFAAMFLAWSLHEVFLFIDKKWKSIVPATITTIILFSIPFSLLAMNYRQSDKSWDHSAVKFAEVIYNSMKKPALLLTDHTTIAFIFTYVNVVEGRWRDVVTAYIPLLEEEWYRSKLAAENTELVLEPEKDLRNLASFVRDNVDRFRIYTRQAHQNKFIPNRFLIPAGPVMEVELGTVEIDQDVIEAHLFLLEGFEKQEQFLDNPFFKANLAITYHNVAWMLIDTGFYQYAFREAQKSIELDPQSPVPYLIISEIREKEGHIEEALEWCEKALSREPYDYGALVKIGTLYERVVKLEEALDVYEKAVELNPELPVAHVKLGLLLHRGGIEPERALLHLNEAVKLGYTQDGIYSVMNELKEIVDQR
jgi:tetratricopeptide (TPR) repeat protein